MTAEIELLPLPEGYDKYSPPQLYDGQMFHEGQMRAYARANSARAIAPLQAEIEALRGTLANARLIAAAPELLAALEGMEKWASSIHDGYPPSTASIAAAPYREAARAAIASVKGPK